VLYSKYTQVIYKNKELFIWLKPIIFFYLPAKAGDNSSAKAGGY
jgi:hypothetical protein